MSPYKPEVAQGSYHLHPSLLVPKHSSARDAFGLKGIHVG